METENENIICGDFVFYNNFDSANLARVEEVEFEETPRNEVREADAKFSANTNNTEETAEHEFNVWTKHDCQGTEYQNSNRTWFYFGIKPNNPGVTIKFNVVNLNRQSKMFSQGMCPVFKTVPGHPHWERVRDKPTYSMDQKGSEFTLSFIYRTPDNPKAISYLAFTYPFTYQDLQQYLNRIDNRMAKRMLLHPDDIYYHRECAIKSLEGRRLDVLTISSFHNISTEREDRLHNMFPDSSDERSFKFRGKKIVFLSARVHPGETPSSFVFNGFLNFLLNRDDPIAVILRRTYVFKLIPMLNPDGVARGHYRMDTRGVNLNRVYLNPSPRDHPTIFAARSLIRYYHNCYEIVNELMFPQDTDLSDNINFQVNRDTMSVVGPTNSVTNVIRDTTNRLLQQVTLMTLDENNRCASDDLRISTDAVHDSSEHLTEACKVKHSETQIDLSDKKICGFKGIGQLPRSPDDSGLFLYIDLHGHASKKGVFMYGNYFDDPDDTITCMLLPKLMSINNPNFHFTSCSFAERNMYLIDKRDGMSREGSGRVAVYKLTGLVQSYTLECNYNSGRLVNALPARVRDGHQKIQSHVFVPPKYTPTVFEEVGAALGPSILDLTNSNPNSRLPNSQYRSLRGLRSFLKLSCSNSNSHSASINRPRNKGNNGTIAKEAPRPEDIVSTMNYFSTSDKDNQQKSETNIVVKSRMIRRTTSLYTVVKRMKNNKKSRQAQANRKSMKNQRISNADNGPIISTIRSSRNGAKLLKPIGYRRSVDTNLHELGTPMVPAVVPRSKRPGKKTNPPIEQSVTNERTTIVKQGSKRMKIISTRIIKTRPEIGESSKVSSDENSTTATEGHHQFRNKPSARTAYVRSRKTSVKNDAKSKPRKSTKLKTKVNSITRLN